MLLGTNVALAEEFSCSADLSSVDDNNRSSGTADGTNCTITWSGINGGNEVIGGNTYWKFDGKDDGSGTYVQLKLNSGSFQAGDVLTVNLATQSGATSAKNVGFRLGSTNGNGNSASVAAGTAANVSYTLVDDDIEDDGTIKIFRNSSDARYFGFSVTGTRATETYTVTFDAGSNGTCETSSLTEESVGAGVVLPEVTAISGYIFRGWYTAVSDGEKAGNAGDTYKPTANITLYAHYSAPSTECLLNQVVYSNSFDAFIIDPKEDKNGTITAYYLDSESKPTITNVKVSDGASYEVEGNTLVVTAEDGKTKSVYDIKLETVKPNTQSEVTFDGTETWIKTGYSYGSDKGWKFSKSVDEDGNKRITEGKNRLYFFVGHANSVTLTNGLVDSERAVKVYVNGIENASITSIPKKSASTHTVTITCNPEVDNMIAIVSNQTGGDGGFTFASISIAAVPVSVGAKGYATYVNSEYALDFTGSSIEAYVALNADENTVELEKVEKLPAKTPVLLYSETGNDSQNIPVINNGEAEDISEEDNCFKAGDGQAHDYKDTERIYVLNTTNVPGFYKASNSVVATDKAYLLMPTNATARFAGLFVEGETTGISQVESNQNAEKSVYNLNGQRVAQPTKGLYIVNGKKVIIK